MWHRFLLGLMMALAGSLIAVAVKAPLPWMLGALVLTALGKMSGIQSVSHPRFRNAGQLVIGVGLGAYFTPAVLQEVTQYLGAIGVGAVFAVMLGFYGTWAIKRFGQVDAKTAYFSSPIGGAAEMSVLAEHYGGRMDLVASAHSLRILTVVVFMSLTFRMMGLGEALPDASSVSVDSPKLILLLGAATAVALLAARFKLPNAWIMGPMLLSILLTSQEWTLSDLPQWMMNGAQLAIGWALGDKFGPSFIKKAPRFLTVVFLFTLTSILLTIACSWIISSMTDIPLATAVLGMAPGGISEMCIMAKVLQLGVPLVTAFQVLRLFVVLMVTGPLYRHVLSKLEVFKTSNVGLVAK